MSNESAMTGTDAVRAEVERVIRELRAYNPAADEYKGEHIHKIWARELESALASQPRVDAGAERKVGCEGDDGLLRIHTESETCDVCAPPLPTGNAALVALWNEAYRAFIGAFDTPASRRKQGDEYASDARDRLRMFDEQFRALTQGTPDEPR